MNPNTARNMPGFKYIRRVTLETTKEEKRASEERCVEWERNERRGFRRLKQLAYSLGIRNVFLSSKNHPLPTRDSIGSYCPFKRQIVVDFRSGELVHTIAHEIGHHIWESLAGLTWEELLDQIPRDAQKASGFNQDYLDDPAEWFAESLANYLEGGPLKGAQMRECERLLSRVKKKSVRAANLIEQYRANVRARLQTADGQIRV